MCLCVCVCVCAAAQAQRALEAVNASESIRNLLQLAKFVSQTAQPSRLLLLWLADVQSILQPYLAVFVELVLDTARMHLVCVLCRLLHVCVARSCFRSTSSSMSCECLCVCVCVCV